MKQNRKLKVKIKKILNYYKTSIIKNIKFKN